MTQSETTFDHIPSRTQLTRVEVAGARPGDAVALGEIVVAFGVASLVVSSAAQPSGDTGATR
ncbi:hypothetical protein [Streptomyces sp. NPDC051909]|uniref:hypothetical protein n=1 Tax=Streptomyces sp. NPDC051909 TaxID=3154944 RepID=UPI0034481256